MQKNIQLLFKFVWKPKYQWIWLLITFMKESSDSAFLLDMFIENSLNTKLNFCRSFCERIKIFKTVIVDNFHKTGCRLNTFSRDVLRLTLNSPRKCEKFKCKVKFFISFWPCFCSIQNCNCLRLPRRGYRCFSVNIEQPLQV